MPDNERLELGVSNKSNRNPETQETFARRVKERTGFSLEEIKEGTSYSLIDSHLLCKSGDIWVVAVGNPTSIDPDNNAPSWENLRCFLKIDVSKSPRLL